MIRFRGPGMHGAGGVPLSSFGGIGQIVAPTWTPLSLASILGWWKSDAGLFEDAAGTTPATDDGDVVGQQADQATVGPYNATQGAAGNKPTLQNAAGDLVNGHPIVQGDALDDWLATTLTPPASGTIAVAFKYNNVANDYICGAVDVTKRCFLSVNGTPRLAGAIGTDATIADTVANLVNGAVYVGVLLWDGANTTLRKNGAIVWGPTPQAGTANGTRPIYLYGVNNNGSVLACCSYPITDIVWCSAALTGADLTSLETYLMGRVGLP